MEPTFRQRLAYERAMWRGLVGCLRHGHHVTTAHGFHPYCWHCFHNYPYEGWIGVMQIVRGFLGRFAKGKMEVPPGPRYNW